MNQRETLSAEETRVARDFLNVAEAVSGSLTSAQVTRLAGAAGEVLPLLELLARPQVRDLLCAVADAAPELTRLLGTVAAYQRSGQIEKALEMATLAGVVRDALSTESVVRRAEDATELAGALDRLAGAFSGAEGLDAAADAAVRAEEESRKDRGKVGLWSLFQALREPGAQRALKFGLHFLRNLERRA